jgi:hypothetical protein
MSDEYSTFPAAVARATEQLGNLNKMYIEDIVLKFNIDISQQQDKGN